MMTLANDDGKKNVSRGGRGVYRAKGKTGVYNVRTPEILPTILTRFNVATKPSSSRTQLTENGRRAFSTELMLISNLLLILFDVSRVPTFTRVTRRWGYSCALLHLLADAYTSTIGTKTRLWESHPNIQSVRSGHRRTWDYTGKDGDIIHEHGDPPLQPGAPPGRDNTIWDQVVASTTKKNFTTMSVDWLLDILFFIRRHSTDMRRSTSPSPERIPRSFDDLSDDRLRQWVRDGALGSGSSGNRRRSLILWGPTRTGKLSGPDHYTRKHTRGTPADPLEHGIILLNTLIANPFLNPKALLLQLSLQHGRTS